MVVNEFRLTPYVSEDVPRESHQDNFLLVYQNFSLHFEQGKISLFWYMYQDYLGIPRFCCVSNYLGIPRPFRSLGSFSFRLLTRTLCNPHYRNDSDTFKIEFEVIYLETYKPHNEA